VLELKHVRVYEDLNETQMSVDIVQGFDMVGEHGELLNVFVKLIYTYHENNSAADAVFTSPSKSGSRNLEFNWSQVLPISRKKSFQKWLESKRLKVELWEIHGLFRSQRLLGRVDAPLESLLRRCEARAIFPVMNARKAVGPSLEVSVRLRVPLLSPHEETLEERFVTVNNWPVAGPSSPPIAKKRTPSQPQQQQQQQQQQQLGVSEDVLAPWSGDAFHEPGNADRFVSLAVLEALAQQWTAKGVEVKSDPSALSEANAQLRHAHMRIFSINAWLKADQHTRHALYVDAVSKAAAEETALATKFKTAGNREEALNCLRRAKMMKTEVEQLQAPEAKPQPQQPQQQPPKQQQQQQPQPQEQPQQAQQKPAEPKKTSAAPAIDHHSVDLMCSVAVLDW
jgi:hypothetical protein